MLKIIAVMLTMLIVIGSAMQSFAIAPGAGQIQMQNNMQQMQQNKQQIEQMREKQQQDQMRQKQMQQDQMQQQNW